MNRGWETRAQAGLGMGTSPASILVDHLGRLTNRKASRARSPDQAGRADGRLTSKEADRAGPTGGRLTSKEPPLSLSLEAADPAAQVGGTNKANLSLDQADGRLINKASMELNLAADQADQAGGRLINKALNLAADGRLTSKEADPTGGRLTSKEPPLSLSLEAADPAAQADGTNKANLSLDQADQADQAGGRLINKASMELNLAADQADPAGGRLTNKALNLAAPHPRKTPTKEQDCRLH